MKKVEQESERESEIAREIERESEIAMHVEDEKGEGSRKGWVCA